MTKKVIEKKTGPKRKDRTIDIWITYGDNLLSKIEGKSRLHKKIKSLLSKLHASKQPKEQQDILINLNRTKDELGKDWALWRDRIRQIDKDKKIKKFKVSDRCYDNLKAVASESGYGKNINKLLEALPDLLKLLGINVLEDFYTLHEELLAYDGALEPEGKSTLQSNDERSDFSILVIVQRILKELKYHKIESYHELKLIKKKKLEVDMCHESIKELLNKRDSCINDLSEKLKERDEEISELKERINNKQSKRLSKTTSNNITNNRFNNRTKK